MNPTTVQQNVNDAQAAGNARQQALNTQSGQLQNNYGQAQTAANTAQQTAASTAAGIQDSGKLYGGYLTAAQNAAGFDPHALTVANQNLITAQNQIANAPMAAQQTGGGYGALAGGATNAYAGMMSNLNPALTNATNSASTFANQNQQYQTQANQQAGLTLQSQTAKASAAAAVYQQSVSQMNVAGQTMTTIEAQAQQQGYLTAEQTTAYQNAYSQYVAAQAQASQAATAAAVGKSQIALNTTANALQQNQLNTALAAQTKTSAATQKDQQDAIDKAVATAIANQKAQDQVAYQKTNSSYNQSPINFQQSLSNPFRIP